MKNWQKPLPKFLQDEGLLVVVQYYNIIILATITTLSIKQIDSSFILLSVFDKIVKQFSFERRNTAQETEKYV